MSQSGIHEYLTLYPKSPSIRGRSSLLISQLQISAPAVATGQLPPSNIVENPAGRIPHRVPNLRGPQSVLSGVVALYRGGRFQQVGLHRVTERSGRGVPSQCSTSSATCRGKVKDYLVCSTLKVVRTF